MSNSPPVHKRVIYYYQTLTDLTPILRLNPQPVTHIILASIHFGIDPETQQKYIHLNNCKPDNPTFNNVWRQLYDAKRNHGIDIRLMIGGAGGGYSSLFNSYDDYYPLLHTLLTSGPAAGIVSGIDLDVEEPVTMANIQRLIKDLHQDFPTFRFTMAPLGSSLYNPGATGMGGFRYCDLLATPEGKLIEWFNGQYYYGDFSEDKFNQTVQTLKDLATPDQIVMGSVTGQWAPGQWQPCYDTLQAIATKYPTMGGTFFWEYYIRPQNWETRVAVAMNVPSSTRTPTTTDTLDIIDKAKITTECKSSCCVM